MKSVTSAQMHLIDQQATEIYSIPSILLMENAARGAFETICGEVDKDREILVVCGSGNNGGDGFAIARMLYIAGYEVKIKFVGSQEKLTTDAKINYEICKKLNIEFTDDLACHVLIDCIFGTGLKRNVEGKYKELIESINQQICYVYSIDIPSGLSSDTGEIMGVSIKANKTLTFQLEKIGLRLKQGPEVAGEIKVIDILIPRELLK